MENCPSSCEDDPWLAKVLLSQLFQVEGVAVFEHGLENLLDSFCGDWRGRKTRHFLCELSHRSDADFVPVEEVVPQGGKSLLCFVVLRIFQAGRKKKVFQHGSLWIGRNGLVAGFLQYLVDLTDLCASIAACHGSAVKIPQVFGAVMRRASSEPFGEHDSGLRFPQGHHQGPGGVTPSTSKSMRIGVRFYQFFIDSSASWAGASPISDGSTASASLGSTSLRILDISIELLTPWSK